MPDWMHNRLLVLLILGPPTCGAILGGAVVHIVRMAFFGAAVTSPDFEITLSLAGLSTAIIAGVVVQSVRIRRGAPTRFPRAFRVVPFVTIAAFALGLALAYRKQVLGLG